MTVPMKIALLPSTSSPTFVSPKTVVPWIVAAPAMIAGGGFVGGDSTKKASGSVSMMLSETVSVLRRTTLGRSSRPVMTRVRDTANEEPLGASPTKVAVMPDVSGDWGFPAVSSATPGTSVQ